MFIGHFAPAIAAAKMRGAPSLPFLLIGGQLIDWAFFGLVLAGIEQMRITPGMTVMNDMDLFHMPYTHSLAGCVAFGLAFAVIIYALSKKPRAAMIGFAVVLSHWFLDVLVHTNDMTLMGRPPRFGLGLWDHPAIEMPLELALVSGALWLYARNNAIPKLRIYALAVVLLVLQAVNWFGPQPKEADANQSLLALFAFGLVALVGWWVHRGFSRAK